VTRAPRPLLPLALACLAFALAAAPARAGTDFSDPNAPLPLGPKRPCSLEPSITPGDAVAAVVPGMAFGFILIDPNDPNNANLFSHLSNCASLCKKAGSTCQKYVKRLASCESHAIDDRAKFVSKVNPPGVDVDPNTVAAEHAAVDDAVTTALGDCTTKANQCAGACDAAP